MNELIDKIEDVVLDILKAGIYSSENKLKLLVELMIETFPEVMAVYYNPLMAGHAQDAAYWPEQLERIIGTINSGDELAVMDVLYNETRPNLIELKGILEGKGIAL